VLKIDSTQRAGPAMRGGHWLSRRPAVAGRKSSFPPLTGSGPPGDSGRFLFLDGVRGLAAMMVVVFHLHENLLPAVHAWFPPFLSAGFSSGNLGVDIFFVLSGFVIAHSVSRGERSWRYLGRFALRRSIRLDPPLWATIAVEIILIVVGRRLFPALGTPLPGWPQVIASVTYSQRFLGLPDIVPVFWSLTYEVQFYIVLVGGLVLLHRVASRQSIAKGLFVLMFCYSLGIWLGAIPAPLRGLFIDRWFQFALGIAAWATFMHHVSKAQFAAVCLFTLCALLVLSPATYRIHSTEVSVIAAAVMAFVSLTGRLESLLAGPVIQFLGRISYSLYLIHASIGWRFISLFRKLFGPDLGPAMGVLAFLGGIGLSVLAAWMMYAALEAPSVKLARRIHLPRAG
jgi:peptidoglycan/LPS O-acetylase OafA/YrhL